MNILKVSKKYIYPGWPLWLSLSYIIYAVIKRFTYKQSTVETNANDMSKSGFPHNGLFEKRKNMLLPSDRFVELRLHLQFTSIKLVSLNREEHYQKG